MLPAKSHLTTLIIADAHFKTYHAGVATTLAQLRKTYWILKGKVAVKKYIQSCHWCKILRHFPFKLPPMPPLPSLRLQQSVPFQYLGLDYFGPLLVKSGQEVFKIWVALFTCLMCRAIHLEYTTTLSGEGFIKCLRRFIARRGTPKLIISDNGQQFKIGERAFNKAATEHEQKAQQDVLHYCAYSKIEWRYITEYSPWSGGIYERMIGLVKKVLKTVLHQRHWQLESLLTVLAESEAVINSRPLTSLSEDPNDALQIVRPVDFLLWKSSIGLPALAENGDDPEYVPTIDTFGKLMQWWHKSETHINKVWEKFKTPYLQMLLEKTQLLHNQSFTSGLQPRERQVVIIDDNEIPRGCWKLGIIKKLILNSEKNVKACELRTSNGKTLIRPVNLLYPLELEVDPKFFTNSKDESTENHPTPLQNRRITRSMTKTMQLLTTVMILFLMTPPITAKNCSNLSHNTAEIKIVYSPSCVPHGSVIKKIGADYCWSTIECHNRHLTSTGTCDTPCTCPSWASDCIHNPAIYNNRDLAQEIKILKRNQPKVCSFEPQTDCDVHPRIDWFFQIETLEGNLFLSETQNVKLEEFDPDNNFTCVGSGEIIGTPEYCEINKNTCQREGNQICFYPQNEQAFLIISDEKIPIKAWGMITKTYYTEKGEQQEEILECQDCIINCSKGGISFKLDNHMEKLTICSKPTARCITVETPKLEDTIPLHPEIAIQDHTVEVQFWSNGIEVKTLEITCPADPLCELIPCSICWLYLGNPQCYTLSAKFYIIIALIFMVTTTVSTGLCSLYLLCKIISKTTFVCFRCTCHGWRIVHNLCCWFKQCTCTACRIVYNLCCWCKLKCFRRRRKLFPNESIPVFKKRNKRQAYSPRNLSDLSVTVTIITFCSLITPIYSCSYATTLMAKTTQCQKLHNLVSECTISETTRVSLVPAGQYTCLQLFTPEHKPLATLKLQIMHIELRCQPETQYFTREYRIKVVAEKRCATSGSCSGSKCHQYNTESKISELGTHANERPGYTYCTESCGCAGCKCFWCSSGCLFYRLFADPVNEKIYEVYRCPIWNLHLDINAELHLPTGELHNLNFTLEPGRTITWKTLQFALIGITIPPLPILSQSFVTDGQRVLTSEVSPAGDPIINTIGEFQCSSKTKAEEFNQCYFPHQACTCSPQETRVHCQCSQHSLEPLFKHSQYKLPLHMPGLTLTHKKDVKTIVGKLEFIASTEIQVTTNNAKFFYVHERAKCVLTIINFSGCYNCLTGAKVQFNCTSDKTTQLGQVKCVEGARFDAHCSPSGIDGEATIHFTKAKIEEECFITCGVTTSFILKGQLVFIEKERKSEITDIRHGNDNKGQINLGFEEIDLGNILSALGKNWLNIIFAVVIIIIVIFLICSCGPICIQRLTQWLSNAQNKISNALKPRFNQSHHTKQV